MLRLISNRGKLRGNRRTVPAAAGLLAGIALGALLVVPGLSAANTPPRCQPTQMSAGLYRFEAGAGQRYATLRLVNHGAAACTLFGYPRFQLLRANGRKLATHNFKEPIDPPQLVTVEPGGHASTQLHWGVVAGRGEPVDRPCEPLPHTLLIFLPDASGHLHLPWHYEQVCQHGRIRATPFI